MTDLRFALTICFANLTNWLTDFRLTIDHRRKKTMAIYQAKFTYVDEQGNDVSRAIVYDVADESALLTAVAADLPKLRALTKSAIVKWAYSKTTKLVDTPDAGSNVDAGCTATWDAPPLTTSPTSKVPDPKEAIKDGQGGIDLTNAAVIAYLDMFLTGSARLNLTLPTQPTSIIRFTIDKP